MAPRRALAWLWLAALGLAGLRLAVVLPTARLDTGVFSLVPWNAPGPAARAGAAAFRRRMEGRLLLLTGARDPARAEAAADACAAVLRGAPGLEAVRSAVPPGGLDRALAAFRPLRRVLLTPDDRAQLAAHPERFLARARSLLFDPGVGGPLGFDQDPLGTFGDWIASQKLLVGRLELRNGHMEADGLGGTWVAVTARAAVPAGGRRGAALERGLARAIAAAREAGADRVLRAGFRFHEDAAAAQARREAGAVGALSTALLALLLLAVFRKPRAMLLALLPAAIGCVFGAAATLTLWPRVHAVALVFGSTVVGVADDYGLYFLSGLYDGAWDPLKREGVCRAPTALAMATSVLGYAALALLPIPALRQVAVFAGVGLVGDWAGVALWYPRWTRGLSPIPLHRVRRAEALRKAWPRWNAPAVLAVLGLACAAAAAGCLRLKVDDDVRLLYAHDAALDREEAEARGLTGIGDATGYFVVRARGPQRLLRREETLQGALARSGSGPWVAVSDFVPSLGLQARDRVSLRRALFGAPGLARRLARSLGRPSLAAVLRRSWRGAGGPAWTPDRWLRTPVAAPWRWLWLPQPGGRLVSLVLPAPGMTQEAVGRLAASVGVLPGVDYVDALSGVGRLLGTLRRLLAWTLALGTAAVFGAMAWRLGRAAPAAILPAGLGAFLAMGALGWSGLPVNLFALLALLLLLSTAVDFGIYLHDGGARLSSFVAVQVAALTNIAAVGVLAFSGTPALRAFGLVLGVGASAAWLAAPCFGAAAVGGRHAQRP